MLALKYSMSSTCNSAMSMRSFRPPELHEKVARGKHYNYKITVQVDFMPVYSNHLREIIKKGINSKKDYNKPLSGFKIAVDAGNGSGGFLATDVLAPLGADIAGSLFSMP